MEVCGIKKFDLWHWQQNIKPNVQTNDAATFTFKHIFSFFFSDIISHSFYVWILTSSGTARMLVNPFLKTTNTRRAPQRRAEVAQSKAVSPAPRTITVPRSSGSAERQLHIPEIQEWRGGEQKKSEKEKKKRILPIEQFSLNSSADACS